ncbi:MAG: FtsX-like permease family protein [Tidjanibacter sp.]|nr:FtsX-like permease family protein [Tidjanibacter sp.]
MSLPSIFALRYMRSKKSLSVINLISRVSSVAIGVAVAAMVILLSVYNGFDTKLRTIYGRTDPDLRVSPVVGKMFDLSKVDTAALAAIDGVAAVATLLEDNVMIQYGDRRMVVAMSGVDDNYTAVVHPDSMLWYGEWRLRNSSRREVVIGRSVDELFADNYSVRNAASHQPLTLYAPRRENISPLLPFSALRTETIFHGGTLLADATNLTNHIFVADDVAERLLGASGKRTSLALSLTPQARVERVRREVQTVIGSDFVVATRIEQNALAYKVMRYEKWIIFFILLLVTIIAAFSIVGSIVMLVVDKRPDMGILSAMGADNRLVRRIFLDEGLLVGGVGVAGGLLLGLLVCWVQWRFGVITIPGSTFLFSVYPVEVRWLDLAGITAAVMAVNYLIANFTVAKMIPRGGNLYETRS